MNVVALLPVGERPALGTAVAPDLPVWLEPSDLASAVDLVGAIRARGAGLVVLDADLDPVATPELTVALASVPGTTVVWVSHAPDALALPALRAGAKDVIALGAGPDVYATVVARTRMAAETGAATTPRETGRVVSVLSPKGGVGKTTVATNLAVGLAQALPQEVVLVDLDVQFGDVASALDLESEYSIVDTVRGGARQDSMVLKAHLTRHRTGLSVVCGPQAPAEADRITPADAADLLNRLAAEFAFVVVDTAPGLDEHTLAAIDASTDLVMVTSLDVPGIRGLRKELDTLNQLGVRADRQVVLNMVDRQGGLTTADAAATIGAPIDVSLPRDRSVVAAVNRGVPLLESTVRNAFTKQLEKVLLRLAPGVTIPRRRGRRPGSVVDDGPEVSVVPRRALLGRPGRRAARRGVPAPAATPVGGAA